MDLGDNNRKRGAKRRKSGWRQLLSISRRRLLSPAARLADESVCPTLCAYSLFCAPHYTRSRGELRRAWGGAEVRPSDLPRATKKAPCRGRRGALGLLLSVSEDDRVTKS